MIASCYRYGPRALSGTTPSPTPSPTPPTPSPTPTWTEHFTPYVYDGDSGHLHTRRLANGPHVLMVKATASNGSTATTQRRRYGTQLNESGHNRRNASAHFPDAQLRRFM